MKIPVSRLVSYLRPYKLRFFQATLAMAAAASIQGLSVYILKPVIDNIFIMKQYSMLMTVVFLLPALFLIKLAAAYTQAYLMSWISQKAVLNIRGDLFRHLHDLSAEFYWRKRSGEIMSRVINDLNSVQSMLQFLPLYLVRDTLTVAAVLGVIFFTHWKFALISILAIPMAGGIIYVLGRKMRKAGAKSQEIVGEISHRFQESLQGMNIVKAFNYEEGAIAKFMQKNQELFSQMMRYLRATALSGPLMEFGGSIILAFMVFYGGNEVIKGALTPGQFFTFLAGFFAAYSPLKNITNANSTFQLGMASWERILQLLNEKPSVKLPANPRPVLSLAGNIRLNNVGYKYPQSSKFAVRGIDIDIKPGEAVAFVGTSGSGKSTLIHLLLRLFDPVEGAVLYDGMDLREINLKQLRSHIGLVTQETVLFDDSVFNNIALGQPDASLNDVIEASRAADAHDFISGLPEGYNTMLGERGTKLSGGQRQRLAIARAVLKKPSALLLDEATSNLDTASEKAVQSALERLLAGRTVIMVAHRLSTIQNAGRIFVLDQGRIIESGSHAELLDRRGIYSRLCEIQSTIEEGK